MFAQKKHFANFYSAGDFRFYKNIPLAFSYATGITLHDPPIPALMNISIAFNVDQCGRETSCFAMTENCKSGDADCAIVSWKHNGDNIEIGIEDTNSGSGYVAVGFAPTNNMRNADIYYCQKDGNEIGVVSAFATANGRPADDADGTGIITESVGTTISVRGGHIFQAVNR